ncbi:MAG: Diguanylate cyclase DosC [Pseudomonas citronellolis]|nr:MAG: Diguanylate cyclase DosC [Pseudomonas citronellolis]
MTLFRTVFETLDPLYGMPDRQRQDFKQWYRQAKLPQIRYVALLTLLLYLLYAALEQDEHGSQPGLRLFAHGLVIPGLLLGIVLLSRVPRQQLWMLRLLSAAPVAAVAINLHLNAQQKSFAYFAPELYLNLMWTFAVSGLPLRRALPTASLSAFLILAVTVGPASEPGPQRLHLLWVLSSFSFGALTALLLENAYKIMFINQQRLTVSASLDGLTSLLNRRKIEEALSDEIRRSERYASAFSVILIDIDHFKSTNDTYGHAVGDAVLRQFSLLLKSNCRSTDRVGRFGGEEFLVVLPGANIDHARAMANILREKVSAFDFDKAGHKTASFGVTQFRLGDDQCSLIDRADKAMYHAKNGGRDRVEIL